MKNKFSLIRSRGVALKTSIAFASLAASSAFADYTTEITAAKTSGLANVTLAAEAVIAIAALVLGIGLVRKLLSN